MIVPFQISFSWINRDPHFRASCGFSFEGSVACIPYAYVSVLDSLRLRAYHYFKFLIFTLLYCGLRHLVFLSNRRSLVVSIRDIDESPFCPMPGPKLPSSREYSFVGYIYAEDQVSTGGNATDPDTQFELRSTFDRGRYSCGVS